MCGSAAPVHEPVEQIARFEHRRIERLAVEADERAGARELVAPRRRASAARPRSASAGYCRVDEAPSSSNQPQPTRNACVPAPPLKPGRLEVEEHERRPRRRAAATSGASRRRRVQTLAERADRARVRARVAGAPRARRRTTPSCSRHSPPRALEDRDRRSRGRDRRREDSAIARGPPGRCRGCDRRASSKRCAQPARLERHAAARVRSAADRESAAPPPSRADRCCRSVRRSRGSRSRTRTPRSAAACSSSSSSCMPEQRRAEADAAGIVVVDEDLRGSGPARRRLAVAAVDRDADVVAVAHQQQLRDLLHRERQADDAVAPIVGRERQQRPSPSPGIVSQYDVVCICCSGRSSSPEPTFSFV